MSTTKSQSSNTFPSELRDILARMTQETGNRDTLTKFLRHVKDLLAEGKSREAQLTARISNAETQLQVQAARIMKYKRACEEFGKYVARLNLIEDAVPSKEPPDNISLDMDTTKQQLSSVGPIPDIFAPHQIPRTAPEVISGGKASTADVQRAAQNTEMLNNFISDNFLNPTYPPGNNFIPHQNPDMALFGDFGN